MATDFTAVRIALCLLACAGCASPSGLLFTRTTTPYFLPQSSRTAKGGKSCSIDITQLREPVSGANVSVIWTSKAVAEAAAKAGIAEIRYADIDTLSILNSLYERRRLIFYGD
jgi:hypothetical protein